MKKRKKGLFFRHGFTLIELLLVMGIIGLLVGIILVSLRQTRTRAKIARAREEARQIYYAFYLLEIDTDQWPGHKTPGEVENGAADNEICSDGCAYGLMDPEAGLRASDGAYANWRGPYLKQDMLDPWGNEYFFDTDYHLSGGEVVAVIGSYGPNGVGRNLYDDDDVIYIIAQ